MGPKILSRALDQATPPARAAELRHCAEEDGGLAAQMGPSLKVRKILEQVSTVAASDFNVLILGETGTGKELVAQAVHKQSKRRHRPFVALDCAAIPEMLLESELFGHEKGAFTGAERRREGWFKLAEGGTVFLDELGNLPLLLQAKLLRVLESRQIQAVGAERSSVLDVRFIAATNQDLKMHIREGSFRADLYFRLAQYTIMLPPLRERIDDIPYLAKKFANEAEVELRSPPAPLSGAALAYLQRYSWPGNVRELRNVIRQAVLQNKEAAISLELLRGILEIEAGALASSGPSGLRSSQISDRSLREIADEAAREAERQAICETLRLTQGNKSQAARTLKTDYKTLHIKMKQLGIRARDFST